MIKTPEQMAEEHANLRCPEQGAEFIVWCMCKEDFLAGYQAAKDQFADADKVMPQWISVKERLPEDKKMVIYWHENFGANVGHYDSTYHKEHYHWFSNNWGDHGDFRVHWWMPLPEPPKGAE